MEKKSLNEQTTSQKSVKVTYKVEMKVNEQPFVQLYELNNLEDAIKAALSVYANIPVTILVAVVDSAGLPYLTLNRYA